MPRIQDNNKPNHQIKQYSQKKINEVRYFSKKASALKVAQYKGHESSGCKYQNFTMQVVKGVFCFLIFCANRSFVGERSRCDFLTDEAYHNTGFENDMLEILCPGLSLTSGNLSAQTHLIVIAENHKFTSDSHFCIQGLLDSLPDVPKALLVEDKGFEFEFSCDEADYKAGPQVVCAGWNTEDSFASIFTGFHKDTRAVTFDVYQTAYALPILEQLDHEENKQEFTTLMDLELADKIDTLSFYIDKQKQSLAGLSPADKRLLEKKFSIYKDFKKTTLQEAMILHRFIMEKILAKRDEGFLYDCIFSSPNLLPEQQLNFDDVIPLAPVYECVQDSEECEDYLEQESYRIEHLIERVQTYKDSGRVVILQAGAFHVTPMPHRFRNNVSDIVVEKSLKQAEAFQSYLFKNNYQAVTFVSDSVLL